MLKNFKDWFFAGLGFGLALVLWNFIQALFSLVYQFMP